LRQGETRLEERRGRWYRSHRSGQAEAGRQPLSGRRPPPPRCRSGARDGCRLPRERRQAYWNVLSLGLDDSIGDALFRFTHPVTGAYY